MEVPFADFTLGRYLANSRVRPGGANPPYCPEAALAVPLPALARWAAGPGRLRGATPRRVWPGGRWEGKPPNSTKLNTTWTTRRKHVITSNNTLLLGAEPCSGTGRRGAQRVHHAARARRARAQRAGRNARGPWAPLLAPLGQVRLQRSRWPWPFVPAMASPGGLAL